MKSLHTIQKLSKIGKVLSGLVAVLCVVFIVAAALGIAESVFFPDGKLAQFGDVTIGGILARDDTLSAAQSRFALTFYILIAASEAIIALLAKRYFTNELAAGTPFTYAGAKELRRLGFLSVILSASAFILGFILYMVFHVDIDPDSLGIRDSYFISRAVAIFLVSLIFQHGAEVAESNGQHK